MPINFLDLPREIRNIIYDQALISPTGYVTPILCKRLSHIPARKKTSKKASQQTGTPPFLQLHLLPCASASLPSGPMHTTSKPSIECGCSLAGTVGIYELPLAFALPRVCKQIQAETEGSFWKHNTICFPQTTLFPKVMKHMGQKPSRKIRSVQLTIDPHQLNAEMFARAIKKLASRTRFGNLHLIEVAPIGFDRWYQCDTFKQIVEDNVKYSAMLHALGKASCADWARDMPGKKVSRVLLVGCENFNGSASALTQWLPEKTHNALIADLHRSWGGKLILNETLVWDGGIKVDADL